MGIFSYGAFLSLKMGTQKNEWVLIGVNVYVFIPMVLFLWLKIGKNFQKWVYIGMGGIFFPWNLRVSPRELQNILLSIK